MRRLSIFFLSLSFTALVAALHMPAFAAENAASGMSDGDKARAARLNDVITTVSSLVEDMLSKGVKFEKFSDSIYVSPDGKKSANSPSYRKEVRLSLIAARVDNRLIAVHDSLLGEQIYFKQSGGKFVNVYVIFRKDNSWELMMMPAGEPAADANRFRFKSFHDAGEYTAKKDAIRAAVARVAALSVSEASR